MDSRWFGLLFSHHNLGEELLLGFAGVQKEELFPKPRARLQPASDELASLTDLLQEDAPKSAASAAGPVPDGGEPVAEEDDFLLEQNAEDVLCKERRKAHGRRAARWGCSQPAVRDCQSGDPAPNFVHGGPAHK